MGRPNGADYLSVHSVGAESAETEVQISWKKENSEFRATYRWQPTHFDILGINGAVANFQSVQTALIPVESFAIESAKVAATSPLTPNTVLARDGANLVAALDNLRDQSEEGFDALRSELKLWIPEFDSILFETPSQGQRSLKLRQKVGKHPIRSVDLSEGTLVALALLYLVHRQRGARVICLEEPDRGLHPRLLRDLRESLYRLAYPEKFGLKREPVQIIATTHSPYFLDLFRESPEEIVIAEKQPDATAKFKRLSDDKKLLDMIGECSLGEVWYTGVLGGVPVYLK